MSHILTGSEPEVLLGSDSGPNAVELVLAALGFCYSVGFVYNAAALGYELEELSYEVEDDLDLRNIVGIDARPPPRLHRDSRQRPCPRQERLPGGSRQAPPVRPGHLAG
jgi:hypothetical protein